MNEWPPSAKPYRASPPEGAVAIALPIRDDLRFFKLCYHSLLAFTDYRFMLTVVDNMSDIKTRQYLESIRKNHNINVLSYQKDHNLAAEWNLGLRFMFAFANVKYGAVLTPTVVFEPFWLSSIVRAIDANKVAGVFTPSEEDSELTVFTRETYEKLEGFKEDVEDPARDFHRRLMKVGGATTFSPIFLHKFKVNGFDPRREERQETQEANHVRA